MKTPEEVILEYLEYETFEPGHPVLKEVARIIWNDMLEEHSCCDVMTFTFNEEIAGKIYAVLHPKPAEPTPEELAAEDAANAAKGLI